jgi:hypothetical protein
VAVSPRHRSSVDQGCGSFSTPPSASSDERSRPTPRGTMEFPAPPRSLTFQNGPGKAGVTSRHRKRSPAGTLTVRAARWGRRASARDEGTSSYRIFGPVQGPPECEVRNAGKSHFVIISAHHDDSHAMSPTTRTPGFLGFQSSGSIMAQLTWQGAMGPYRALLNAMSRAP